MRTAIQIFGFVSLLASYIPDAPAVRMEAATYAYPYRNPYMATTTVALMKGREAEADERIVDLRLQLVDGRDRIPLLEGKGKLRYRFYRQRGFAPLVFIVPGFGSSAYAGSARYLAEWMAGLGFHVIVLPSPFNWNFSLAASRSGVPGNSPADAEDLYRTMQSVLAEARNHQHAAIGAIGVMGWSHGALSTAFLSRVDAAQGRIGIGTFLLINPPVDLLAAARKLDAMAAWGEHLSPERRQYLEDYAAGIVRSAYRRGDVDDPGYFTGWERRLHLSDAQMQYLLGRQMQNAIGDTAHAIELAQHPGVLTMPVSQDVRSGRLREARSIGLMGYVKRFLLPHVRRAENRAINADRLNQRLSLQAIGPDLQADPRVHLMHNLDDFLVSREDITYLESLFADRARIYPRGGHLGNLWFRQNREDILRVFASLFGASRRPPAPDVRLIRGPGPDAPAVFPAPRSERVQPQNALPQASR